MEIQHKDGGLQCDIDGCTKRAEWNVQSGWATYKINKKGNYSRTPVFNVDDDVNEHRCDEHLHD